MNQTDLLDQFILEARECLEQISDRLLQVEKFPEDAELLNDLFRLVHTLKGNCGLFDFKALERVVHAGEDLLDRVRQGSLAYGNDIADALLEAMDFTAQMIDDIEQHGSVTTAADGRSQALAQALRAHLPVVTPKVEIIQASASSWMTDSMRSAATTLAHPEWVSRIPENLSQAYTNAVMWRYQPERTCFFKGEDPWLMVKQVPGLVHMDVGTQAPWPNMSDADCYDCNLSFVGLSKATLADVTEHFRCVPEQVEILQAPGPATLPTPTEIIGDPEADAAPGVMHWRAVQIWDHQLQLLKQGNASTGTVRAVRTTFQHILQALGSQHHEAMTSLEALPPDALATQLADWAAKHRPGTTDPKQRLASSTHEMPSEARLDDNAISPSDTPRRVLQDEASHPKMLKVGQEKIDRLMDLIGEMVVAKNALPYLAQRAENHFHQRELAREIKAQYSVINRIAEDMQHAIMQVRMMPVGVVFQRFGRLVRDISRKLGKEVELVIEGEETEADKNVIESLADPLIHIIRNSLDHGIEAPATRTQAGKPALGTIRVIARQESDRVIIEIQDDGAGIDPQRVRRKAIERGLIPEDKAHTLSDAEAIQLIFLPGFSTSDTISDLSGRGVGMDVVRTAVERINGTVELSSAHGQGTSLRLSLPLSMAVTNVMIIEADGRRFGVPMDLIVETVRVHADDIHHFKQARTTVLRGRIVPLQALNDLLALEHPPLTNEDDEYAVLVVRSGHESMGLLVDQFHGATDIILKPLDGVLSGLTGFAGTALMGDGSVLMVLNPKELM